MGKIGEALWGVLENVMKVMVCKGLHIRMQESTWEKFVQFVKFAMVGLSNVIVSYVVYLVFFLLFQKVGILSDMDYLVAQWIGYVLSIFWSFYWNRKYVFAAGQNEEAWYIVLVKSFIAYSFTGVFLNSILLIFWVQAVGISKVIAPMINLIINVPVNFIMNKFWAFREKKT